MFWLNRFKICLQTIHINENTHARARQTLYFDISRACKQTVVRNLWLRTFSHRICYMYRMSVCIQRKHTAIDRMY